MPRPELSAATTLCISLASRPSTIGTRFHNFLYEELGLDFLYKAFTTDDLRGAIAGVRALGIRGVGVSMPFKEAALDLVDEVEDSAATLGAVNTIVNSNGRLTAANTDRIAVSALIAEQRLPTDMEVAVAGSGGMARAVIAALHEHGLATGIVVARNEATGRALARQYGYEWTERLGARRPNLLVNATPVGMAPDHHSGALPFPADAVERADAIIDVVAFPADTAMIRRATERGVRVISGADIIARQAAEQFERYTGVRPSPDQVERAAAWSRR